MPGALPDRRAARSAGGTRNEVPSADPPFWSSIQRTRPPRVGAGGEARPRLPPRARRRRLLPLSRRSSARRRVRGSRPTFPPPWASSTSLTFRSSRRTSPRPRHRARTYPSRRSAPRPAPRATNPGLATKTPASAFPRPGPFGDVNLDLPAIPADLPEARRSPPKPPPLRASPTQVPLPKPAADLPAPKRGSLVDLPAVAADLPEVAASLPGIAGALPVPAASPPKPVPSHAGSGFREIDSPTAADALPAALPPDHHLPVRAAATPPPSGAVSFREIRASARALAQHQPHHRHVGACCRRVPHNLGRLRKSRVRREAPRAPHIVARPDSSERRRLRRWRDDVRRGRLVVAAGGPFE